MSNEYDIYAFLFNKQKQKNRGRILNKLVDKLPKSITKRERTIKDRITKGSALKDEIFSTFSYFIIKELAMYRHYFVGESHTRENPFKQFSEDVRTAYKWFILPSLDVFSELTNEFHFQEHFLEVFKTTNEFDEPKTLPAHSIYIQIKFTLKRPYLSRDDEDFYIMDNPIVKDKVFKLPIVRPTTWKGALRFAALKIFEEEFDEESWKKKREIIFRLFGNEKDSFENYFNNVIAKKLRKDIETIEREWKEYLENRGYITEKISSFRGRLIFYPTFFDKMSLEVITPLERDTKTPARGPIYFEIVPEGTIGIFRLLYYPFDLVARGEFDKINEVTREDMEFLAKSLKKMFYELGFSAKKTSGFGTVEKIQKENIKIVPKDGEVDVKTILLRELYR